MKALFRTVAGTLASLAGTPVFADQVGPRSYGHMYWDGPWHGWFVGPFMMIIFLVIVVVVSILVVRWLGGHGPGQSGPHHPPPGRSPLDILKERFAKGEIDKDEFEERRRVLGE